MIAQASSFLLRRKTAITQIAGLTREGILMAIR